MSADASGGPAEPVPVELAELNEEQREAALDLEHHIILSSGAGCGKTRVLVARVLMVLSQPGASVDRIVAITFGRKAAGEMVDRLRRACRDLSARAATPDERRRWRRHLRDLERARISTIHAFCARILRENAALAGVDPNFTVIEDLPATMRQEEAVAQVTTEALADDDGDVRRLVLHYGLGRLRRLLVHLLSTRPRLERVAAQGEGAGDDPRALLAHWREAVLEELPPLERDLREALEGVAPDTEDHLARVCFEALEAIGKARSASDPALALGLLRESACRTNLQGCSRRNWPDEERFQRAKNALTRLRSLLGKGKPQLAAEEAADLEREAAETTLALLRLFRRCEQRYEQIKRGAGELDFDDLLLKTRQLLRSSSQTRQRLRESMEHLLVDELQDTNFLQLDIVLDLIGGEGEGPVLFAVGDPKQSIYRFRGAEVEVFDCLRRRLEDWPSGRVLSLRRTYRTHREGVGFTNGFFGPLFREGGMSYEEVESALDVEPPPLPVMDLTTEGPEGANTGACRIIEANRLARFIRWMVEEEGMPVREGDSRRPISYGDIVLLFRAFSDVAVYERALEEAGVPFYTVGGRTFFARPEVKDVLLALRAIDNLHDELALVGMLRSPLVGLSDEGLYWLSRCSGGGGLVEGLERVGELADLSEEDHIALRRAASLLHRLRALRDRLPVAELIRRLLAETGYDAAALTMFAGRRRLANLRRLVDLAAELEPFGTLTQVVQRLDQLVSTVSPGEEAPTAEEAGNVVRLMTIHQAKGLEFPVVILPDLARQGRGRNRYDLLLDPHLGPVTRIPGPRGGTFPPLAYIQARERHRADEEAEEKRLFYVAATRARDRLVLSAVFKRGDGGRRSTWIRWLTGREHLLSPPPPEAGLDEVSSSPPPARHPIDRVVRRGRVDRSRLERLEVAAESICRNAPPIDAGALRSRISPLPPAWSGRRTFSVREFVEYLRCPFAYRLRYLEGFPDPLPSFAEGEGEGGVSAVLQGRLAHAVLERVDLSGDGGEVDRAIEAALAREETLPPGREGDVRRRVRRIVEAFLESPWAERVRRAERVEREVDFVLRLGEGEGGIVVRGRIDLLWRDPTGDWYLVDYKAELVESDEVPQRVERAWLQVAAYARALSARTGQVPAKVVLFYLLPGVGQEVPRDLFNLRCAESELLELARKIRRGEFEPSRAGCARCPYACVCSAFRLE